jgi:hypothetical protein
MKKTTLVFFIIICLLIGYVLGNFFPVNIFGSEQVKHPFSLSVEKDEGIQGNARLEVTLKMDNGRLLDNVEVDLAEEPGPPPIGGVALSDENGLAVFNVKPGNYFIFFNDNNFPKNVESPEAQPVEVLADKVNQKTIILNIKK